jgi:hypothetical protein
MSDLGPLSYFLGIEVQQTSKGLYLSQSKYIQDLLDRSGITDTRTVATPMDIHLKLRPQDGTPLADPTIVILWVVLFISPSPDLILLMLFIC